MPHQGKDEQLGTNYFVKGCKAALSLVKVTVSSPESGRVFHTHALLDSGSNVTLCDERLIRELKITGRKETLRLTTMESADSEAHTEVVCLMVQGHGANTTISLPRAFSRKSLNMNCDSLVTLEEVDQWLHLQKLSIPRAKVEVMLLIRQDCPHALAPLSSVLGASGEPCAMQTCLGWTVNGAFSGEGCAREPTTCSTRAKWQERTSVECQGT